MRKAVQDVPGQTLFVFFQVTRFTFLIISSLAIGTGGIEVKRVPVKSSGPERVSVHSGLAIGSGPRFLFQRHAASGGTSSKLMFMMKADGCAAVGVGGLTGNSFPSTPNGNADLIPRIQRIRI